MFKGVLIEKDQQGYRADLKELDDAVLMDGDTLENVATVIGLAQRCDTAQRLLDGQVRGRVEVNVNQF
uniref:Uncharacterized protein n=1 Tax=Rheinheimera sp. BAL341 TaxID=1708203 RepID=A0A486XGG3_9GAMM